MPNRILKERICTSESVDRLSWFEEVLFYRLIVNCDDFGRFDGRISIIKNRLFPLKDNLTVKAVEAGINKLASAGLVILFMYEDRPYLYLPTWNEHQRIRNQKSKYPSPDSGNPLTIDRNSRSIAAVIQSESESNPNPNPNPNPTRDAALAAVMSVFMDKLNPSPPGIVVEELKGFCAELAPDVILHAFDVAMAERKTAWSYIRAILRRYVSSGLKTMEAVAESEQRHQSGKPEVAPPEDPGREEFERMKKLHEKIRGGG